MTALLFLLVNRLDIYFTPKVFILFSILFQINVKILFGFSCVQLPYRFVLRNNLRFISATVALHHNQ